VPAKALLPDPWFPHPGDSEGQILNDTQAHDTHDLAPDYLFQWQAPAWHHLQGPESTGVRFISQSHEDEGTTKYTVETARKLIWIGARMRVAQVVMVTSIVCQKSPHHLPGQPSLAGFVLARGGLTF
jgi:hypothetical protein